MLMINYLTQRVCLFSNYNYQLLFHTANNGVLDGGYGALDDDEKLILESLNENKKRKKKNGNASPRRGVLAHTVDPLS